MRLVARKDCVRNERGAPDTSVLIGPEGQLIGIFRFAFAAKVNWQLKVSRLFSVRQLTTCALGQLAHFGNKNALRSWREESRRRVKATAFIATFFKHAG